MSDYNITRNLNALTAMASNLVPYLYEEELFGQLGGNLPKLTIGGLLMRVYQLRHLETQLSAKQQQELHDAVMNWESERSEWITHYEQKIQRELESRLGALRWYLDDCAKDPGSSNSGWLNEAEKRTMIEHLLAEAKEFDILTDELTSQVASIDSHIRQFHKNGDFLWPAELQAAYPVENYWWLYGRMTDRNDV